MKIDLKPQPKISEIIKKSNIYTKTKNNNIKIKN